MVAYVTRTYDLVVPLAGGNPRWPLTGGGEGYSCTARWWSTIAGYGGAFPENPIYIWNDASARSCVVAHAASGCGGDWSGDAFSPAGDPGNGLGWSTGAPCPVMTPSYGWGGAGRSASFDWSSVTGFGTPSFAVTVRSSRVWVALNTGVGTLPLPGGYSTINNAWARMVDDRIAAGDTGANILWPDRAYGGDPSGAIWPSFSAGIQWSASAVAGRITNTGAGALVVGSSPANFGTSWPRTAGAPVAYRVEPGATSPWVQLTAGAPFNQGGGAPGWPEQTPWGSLDVTDPHADPGFDPGPTSGSYGSTFTVELRISVVRTSSTPQQVAPPLAARGRVGNLDANAHAARATRTSQGLLTARGML